MTNIVLNEGYDSNKPVFTKASGAYIYDTNNQQYLDTTIGSGTHILGHNHPNIVKALKQQLDTSVLFTTNNHLTFEVADLIKQCVPYIDNVVFCNSGSEATMRAARIARAYTKKKKIALFSGGWHGGNELFLYDYDYAKDDKKSYHKSAGIPDEFKDLVIVLPYNDNEAFNIIEKNKDDIAMVIIEPAQGSNPRDDMQTFLSQLRTVTKENNILLCFDEMITGFRVALGGAQEYYNIEADLVTYGKTIGGGLPIGVVAGKNKFMQRIKANNEELPVFMGGTFSANPMTMASAKALLQYLLEHKYELYKDLENKATHIKNQLNEHFTSNNISCRMIGINSMLRLVYTDYPIKSRQDRDKYEIPYNQQTAFVQMLLEKKRIFINSNGIIFLSTAHTSENVDYLINSIINTIKF